MGLLSIRKGGTWTWSCPQREEAVKRWMQGEDSHPQAEGRSGLPEAGEERAPVSQPACGLPLCLLWRSPFPVSPLGLFLFLPDSEMFFIYVLVPSLGRLSEGPMSSPAPWCVPSLFLTGNVRLERSSTLPFPHLSP